MDFAYPKVVTKISLPDRKVILKDDPDYQPHEGAFMQFRLTYEGPLLATQKDPVSGQVDRRAGHKHTIRQIFHPQMKRLWEITPFLRKGTGSGPKSILLESSPPNVVYDQTTLAARHFLYGWNFVPLVTRDLNLICGLDILFLRPDPPGSVVQSGDIDNRMKTLFDALSVPSANENYGHISAIPDEKPFFCLLEDDRLITKIAVETDQLLHFSDPGKPDQHDVRLVITVNLRPYEIHTGNLQFA
jgi:hypothetical protein